jgi:uncharacterized tellurite resistance protein B-like protein
MTHPLSPGERLYHLGILYLMVAYGADDHLSPREVESVVELLQQKYPARDRFQLQGALARVIADEQPIDPLERAARSAEVLAAFLSDAEKREILDDLVSVGNADGVLLDSERKMLDHIAGVWGLSAGMSQPATARQSATESPHQVLVHLAYIYIVLGHGVDHDLSPPEQRVIMTKLGEWARDAKGGLDPEQIMRAALQRYGEGDNQELTRESVAAVAHDLPPDRRKAALRDLVQIANADGVFLDGEEDLINSLMQEWKIPPGGWLGTA